MFKAFVIAILWMSSFGCRSPKEKSTLENFKSVDSSLNATNDQILTQANIKSFDTTGKSLATAFDSARYLIHVLRDRLKKLDPTGEQLGVSDSLIRDKDAHELYFKMKRIYSLEKGSEKTITVTKDQWLKQYFRLIPTIAAKTILSKFDNDVLIIQQNQ